MTVGCSFSVDTRYQTGRRVLMHGLHGLADVATG